MAFTYPITIIDSQIYINGNLYSGDATSASSGRMLTHNLSDQIGEGILQFSLNPQPVIETLIVVLDGLVLAKDEDYVISGAGNAITLLYPDGASLNLPDPAIPGSGSVLLAIYEEA